MKKIVTRLARKCPKVGYFEPKCWPLSCYNFLVNIPYIECIQSIRRTVRKSLLAKPWKRSSLPKESNLTMPKKINETKNKKRKVFLGSKRVEECKGQNASSLSGRDYPLSWYRKGWTLVISVRLWPHFRLIISLLTRKLTPIFSCLHGLTARHPLYPVLPRPLARCSHPFFIRVVGAGIISCKLEPTGRRLRPANFRFRFSERFSFRDSCVSRHAKFRNYYVRHNVCTNVI